MSTAISRRRGTTVQHSTFTGLVGEVTIDTDKNVAVVHDGATAGGHPLAPEALVSGGTEGQILAILAGGSRGWVDNVGYAKGPWTPSILFGGSGAGQAYGPNTIGGFVRIGDLVFARFRVDFTNKGTGTGSATLVGLPFPINSDAIGGGSFTVGYYTGMNLPNNGIAGFPSTGTDVTLRSLGVSSASGLNETHFTNASVMIGGIVYEAAP